MKYQELRHAVDDTFQADGVQVKPETLRALLEDADKGEELKKFIATFVMILPMLAEAADIDLERTAIKFHANDAPLASISMQELIDKARAALPKGEQHGG